jgi:Uma2 family endonuclease
MTRDDPTPEPNGDFDNSPDGEESLPVLAPEEYPDISNLVTEDGQPLENIFIEKQQRLFTEPLYSSWSPPGENRTFLAASNVGVFIATGAPPLVPDGLLSLDVAAAKDLTRKENRSYLIWVFGKAPDVAIEVVSDRRGGEDGFTLKGYARIGIPYYVIYDPENYLEQGVLRAFVLHGGAYQPIDPKWLPNVGLGLVLWHGAFEKHEATWLRWCDREGKVIPTGQERAEQERQRADQIQQQLDEQRQRADREHQRAERLAAQLRALGIELPPDT